MTIAPHDRTLYHLGQEDTTTLTLSAQIGRYAAGMGCGSRVARAARWMALPVRPRSGCEPRALRNGNRGVALQDLPPWSQQAVVHSQELPVAPALSVPSSYSGLRSRRGRVRGCEEGRSRLAPRSPRRTGWASPAVVEAQTSTEVAASPILVSVSAYGAPGQPPGGARPLPPS